MDIPVGITIVLAVAGVAAFIGVVLGIVMLAPMVRRALDRADANEEPGDRPD